MDTLTRKQRSERMSKIRSKNTGVEMCVRKTVHGLGYRYRLHDKRLPGCPDLVFRSRKKVIFVHGCFWHLHANCKQYRLPKTKQRFWLPKLQENKKRDVANRRSLKMMGWNILTLWECELRKDLEGRIRRFLEDSP